MNNLNFQKFICEVDSSAAYQTRISQGKDIETQIRQAMKRDMGWITINASSRDDMYNGIDCWITSKDGGKTNISQIPIQIKARKNSSENDILWETIKPWNDDISSIYHDRGSNIFTGKDMKCKATLIVSVSNDGLILRFRSVEEILGIAKKMADQLIEDYMSRGYKFAKTKWGEVRVVKDPSQFATYNRTGDVYKVNCFISPNSFEWKQDVRLSKPIGSV